MRCNNDAAAAAPTAASAQLSLPAVHKNDGNTTVAFVARVQNMAKECANNKADSAAGLIDKGRDADGKEVVQDYTSVFVRAAWKTEENMGKPLDDYVQYVHN